jgi:hypothetical protein
MGEATTTDYESGQQSKSEIYRSPDYTSLYRFENPTIPYDEGIREAGLVSKRSLIGSWFTDDLSSLQTYALARIKGVRGGQFVVVRVKNTDLEKYRAVNNPDAFDMDIEKDNYVIPKDVASQSEVVIGSLFKDEWEGKRTVPFADRKLVRDYINTKLSSEAIISLLENGLV